MLDAVRARALTAEVEGQVGTVSEFRRMLVYLAEKALVLPDALRSLVHGHRPRTGGANASAVWPDVSEAPGAGT